MRNGQYGNGFPQAITGKLLLRRRGIPNTLYLGVIVSEDRTALEAHARLRCGPLSVSGGNGDEKYAVVGIVGG